MARQRRSSRSARRAKGRAARRQGTASSRTKLRQSEPQRQFYSQEGTAKATAQAQEEERQWTSLRRRGRGWYGGWY